MDPLRIFLTTWNTGLQGSKAQSQDLTSWLLPVLHQSANNAELDSAIPDIYAIGVQELLPVHLARTFAVAVRKRTQHADISCWPILARFDSSQ